MEKALGAAAVAALALAIPAPALAKGVTERVDVFPSHPRVGRPTSIQIRPYELSSGIPPALLPATFRWHVFAYPPRGPRFRITFTRRAGDPFVWTGVVRFRRPGHWLISVMNNPPDVPQGLTLELDVRRGRASVWDRLERPFRAPTVPIGTACPTATPDPRGSLTRIGFVGTAWGPGPVYPAGLGDDRPVLGYVYPPPPTSGWGEWGGNKVNWLRDPAYRGPVLIRGLRLDGADELRFNDGLIPSLSMLQRGRTDPSYTRVRTPGCYAYQVDGTTFSYTIVFEAKIFGS